MAFVYMEVGDADDDEIIRVDTEGFPEFRIGRDGVEISDVDAIRDDSNFFRMHADVFDIEIFHGDGVGEILIDEGSSHPFEDACDEIFRMVVGRTEEGDDGDLFGCGDWIASSKTPRKDGGEGSEEKAAEHIGMEEVGDDDIRTLTTDELSEAKDTRNIEYAGAGDGFDGDTC